MSPASGSVVMVAWMGGPLARSRGPVPRERVDAVSGFLARQHRVIGPLETLDRVFQRRDGTARSEARISQLEGLHTLQPDVLAGRPVEALDREPHARHAACLTQVKCEQNDSGTRDNIERDAIACTSSPHNVHGRPAAAPDRRNRPRVQHAHGQGCVTPPRMTVKYWLRCARRAGPFRSLSSR